LDFPSCLRIDPKNKVGKFHLSRYLRDLSKKTRKKANKEDFGKNDARNQLHGDSKDFAFYASAKMIPKISLKLSG